MNLRDLRLLAIGVLLFGGGWPITKDALRDATPLWFAVSRAGLAALGAAALLLALRADAPEAAAVLVKGSRFMQMERVVAALQRGGGDAT